MYTKRKRGYSIGRGDPEYVQQLQDRLADKRRAEELRREYHAPNGMAGSGATINHDSSRQAARGKGRS